MVVYLENTYKAEEPVNVALVSYEDIIKEMPYELV